MTSNMHNFPLCKCLVKNRERTFIESLEKFEWFVIQPYITMDPSLYILTVRRIEIAEKLIERAL